MALETARLFTAYEVKNYYTNTNYTNHECPMSRTFPERCLELSFTALFLPQKRLMSSMASQKHRVQVRAQKRIGHGLDISCGFVGPSCRVFMTSSRIKKKCSKKKKKYIYIYNYIINMQCVCVCVFSNALRAKCVVSVAVGGKGWLGASQGGNLPEPQNHEPSSHVVALCFSHACLTQMNVTFKYFQPNHFGRTPPKATAPDVLHHREF